jgi:ribosomal protein S18 acetylase RimI-like enzyme
MVIMLIRTEIGVVSFMHITIIKGEQFHLEACCEALMRSDIGVAYFSSFDPRKILLEGLLNNDIDVALDESNNCIGFIWYERYGAFGMHTYLHMIAVKQELRGRGIGKRLIALFEEKTFKEDNMIFLLVAHFNEKAYKLYESLGYRQVGIIPGFYRKDINERLLMKTKV